MNQNTIDDQSKFPSNFYKAQNGLHVLNPQYVEEENENKFWYYMSTFSCLPKK